jgi:cell wall-associated NlpC family hydrolase
MIDIAKAIEAARACIDVPYKHQGRDARDGLDCSGLVLHALREGGWEPQKPELSLRTNYSRLPIDFWFVSALEAEAVRLSKPVERSLRRLRPLDVLFFRYAGEKAPRHVALVTECDRNAGRGEYDWVSRGGVKICHTSYNASVCEHTMTSEWASQVVAAYRLHELFTPADARAEVEAHWAWEQEFLTSVQPLASVQPSVNSAEGNSVEENNAGL